MITLAQRNLLTYTASSAYNLLPVTMVDNRANQLLFAIGFQESRFQHRAQIGGPARGFWQFEKNGGVKGVLEHPLTKVPIRNVLLDLHYPANMDAQACWMAIEHNDTLAFCFARLLLYTEPKPLPNLTDANEGWQQYLRTWRPGKPHPKTWGAAWDFATNINAVLL